MTVNRVTKASQKIRDKNGTPLLFSSLCSCVLDSGQEVPTELRTEQFREAWNRWVKHRSEIRKPMKPTQAESLLREMAAMGVERAIVAINHTVANGWQGLKEPDDAKRVRKQGALTGFIA